VARDSIVIEDFRPSSARSAMPRTKEVHLWTVDLRPDAGRVAALRRLLTPAEIARGERFQFERHRRRFIVRRGALRQLVGSYLGQDPAAVRFEEGDKGKPYVSESSDPAAAAFHFNLSDSEDLAIYAFTRGAEIGVDVEILRPMPDAQGIAEHFFSAEERVALGQVPDERKSEAFFNCWTRKEAYIKAIGEGLSEPLDKFSVTLLPEDPVRFLHLGGDPERARQWELHHLIPEPGAIGALAMEGEGWRVTDCFKLELGG